MNSSPKHPYIHPSVCLSLHSVILQSIPSILFIFCHSIYHSVVLFIFIQLFYLLFYHYSIYILLSIVLIFSLAIVLLFSLLFCHLSIICSFIHSFIQYLFCCSSYRSVVIAIVLSFIHHLFIHSFIQYLFCCSSYRSVIHSSMRPSTFKHGLILVLILLSYCCYVFVVRPTFCTLYWTVFKYFILLYFMNRSIKINYR